MDVTRNEFQDLVGAYALDACDPEEAAAIDAYIAAARRRRRRGRATARRRGVARRGRRAEPAGGSPRVVCSPPRPSVPTRFRRSTRCAASRTGFEALLDSLGASDLDVTTYNGLSVRDLVAHIAIVDEAFVARGHRGRDRRAGTWSFIGADAVAAMTEAQLPETAGWSFERDSRPRIAGPRQALIDLDAQLAARRPVRRLLARGRCW